MTKKLKEMSTRYPYWFKKEADKVLKEFVEICESLQIPVFLCEGTCLGIVRDGTYTRTDHDVDLGIICTNEQMLKLVQKAIRQGFKRPAGFRKNNIYIDLHSKYCKEEWNFIQKFDQINYNGRIYNIPHPINEYLEWRYGQDWKRPKDKPAGAKFLIELGYLNKEDIDPKLLKLIYPEK